MNQKLFWLDVNETKKKKITFFLIFIFVAGGSGKSCLGMRLAHDEFPEDFIPTVLDAFRVKIPLCEGITFDLCLWDTMARSAESEER